MSVPAQGREPDFAIHRVVFAKGIENREPVGAAVVFAAGTPKVYCFIEALDIVKDTTLTVIWIHEGEEVHLTELPLSAGPRWRTRAEKTIRGFNGSWQVEIRDGTGSLVSAAGFRVE
nr:DUF2914 domain-containing protein [Desulfobotulus pelophilus]